MKLWNYVFIFTTIALFFLLAGIDVAGISTITDNLGFTDLTSTDREISFDSGWNDEVFKIVGLIAGAGILIGIFARGKPENYLIAGILSGGLLVLFGGFMYSIINFAFIEAEWIGYVTLVIMAPLSAGFLFSLVEFIRGTD